LQTKMIDDSVSLNPSCCTSAFLSTALSIFFINYCEQSPLLVFIVSSIELHTSSSRRTHNTMTSNPPVTRGTINLTNSTIQLPTKPTSHLSYTFSPGTPTTKTLVVFLNGLILPKSSWQPSIIATQIKCLDNNIPQPHLLSYDRYGQGDSDTHPDDTHDIVSVVNDLHTLLTTFCEQKLQTAMSEMKMVLVANSIGCAIARLYCASHPSTNISGLILLDSIMAHVNLVSLWPDVDAPGFDKSSLPEGTTIEEIESVRQQYKQRFHVSAPNPENLDRSNLAQLLPHAGSPTLQGNPFLTIVGHDAETFAEENEVSIFVFRYKKAV